MEDAELLDKTHAVTWKRVLVKYPDGCTEEIEYSYRLSDPLTDSCGSRGLSPNKILEHDLDNPEFYGDNSGITLPEEEKDFRVNPGHVVKIRTLEEKRYKYRAKIAKIENPRTRENKYQPQSEIKKEVIEV